MYGCEPDAITAYLQALLLAHIATWVAIPIELWPEDGSWQRMGFKNHGDDRPMCRLYKALYGHPEAGGNWERLLNKSMKELGPIPVPGHKEFVLVPETVPTPHGLRR